MANEWSLDLAGTGANQFTAAKKVFSSNVIRHFLAKLRAWSMIKQEPLEGAVSKDTLRWYKMEAYRHIPHAELSGEQLKKKVITVRLEDEETVASTNLSKRDELINHFDHKGSAAKSAGESLAELFEVHALCAHIEAARTAADGVFPGGQQVVRAGDAVIATAYPMSIVGSQLLQADIEECQRLAFEDDVPDEMESYCFMKRRQYDVLKKDLTLMSRDYVGSAFSDLIHGKLLMVANAWIIPTNLYPETDRTAYTFPLKSEAVVLNGDYSDSVCVITRAEAVRKTVIETITPMYDWVTTKRHWEIGAAAMKGLDTWRPECAAEVRVSA